METECIRLDRKIVEDWLNWELCVLLNIPFSAGFKLQIFIVFYMHCAVHYHYYNYNYYYFICFILGCLKLHALMFLSWPGLFCKGDP